jgi:hypothetical protein
MSEDKFFQLVQGKLENFSPEVPQAAYAGMRRKYAVSKFMSWNAGRLNVWYALLLVGVASATVVGLNSNSTEVAKQAAYAPIEIMAIPQVNKANENREGSCIVYTNAQPTCTASVKKAKGNENVLVLNPASEIPEVLVNPSPIVTPFVAEGPVENILNQDTPKVEEIVKAKEEPVKRKTVLTIPVYENKDK